MPQLSLAKIARLHDDHEGLLTMTETTSRVDVPSHPRRDLVLWDGD